MSNTNAGPARLRQLLRDGTFVVAPGAYDAVSAKLVERAGFPAVYMSGNGVSAVHGMPDVNLLTLSEIAAAARIITQSTSLPVIADADTGYGGLGNVRRCIQEFEAAGLAAIHIEDQNFPKACAGLEIGKLTPIKEMCYRIDVAIAERRNADFMLIARSDFEGDLDETLERLKAYRSAGADALMVVGVRTVDQVRRITDEVDAVHLYNYGGSDRGPKLVEADIEKYGYRMLTYSIFGMRLMARAYQAMLGDLHRTRNIVPWFEKMMSWPEYQELTGVPEHLEFIRKYEEA